MGKDQELLEGARRGNVAVVEKILGQRAKRSGPCKVGYDQLSVVCCFFFKFSLTVKQLDHYFKLQYIFYQIISFSCPPISDLQNICLLLVHYSYIVICLTFFLPMIKSCDLLHFCIFI